MLNKAIIIFTSKPGETDEKERRRRLYVQDQLQQSPLRLQEDIKAVWRSLQMCRDELPKPRSA